MATIEADNPPIHRAGPRLCPRSRRNHLDLKYAKQTQFPKGRNARNYLWNKGLSQYPPARTAKKQTQFQFPHRRSEFIPTRRDRAGNQPHHPRTAQPSTNMQNKPNFRKANISLTSYGCKNYENMRLRTP